MSSKKYILVGGYPAENKEQHPGGQVTASRLLIEYAVENGIELYVIDTSQSSFPIPSFRERVKSAWMRMKKLQKYLSTKEIGGVIIFSSSGFSFYEKVLMTLLTNFYQTQSMLFIRSGHFINFNEKRTVLKIINKMLLKLPTYIGAQGEKWIEFYEDMNVKRSKLKLIHNWIRIDHRNSYASSSAHVVFLFVGWMVEKKGVLDLFNVIERYKDLDTYEFRFAGEGTLYKELQKKVEEKNIANIKLLGWQSHKELQHEYKYADVFVLPSYAEGFPNVILEALNHQLPIISTDVGGISDSVMNDYNGCLIEPNDQKALYQSIKKLGESLELRKKFSQNSALMLKKNHDYHESCKKVFDIFESSNE